MPALHALAGECAEADLNTLLIEWEATFPFRKHAIVSNTCAYTAQEIDGFIRHCTQLGLEVIPLQQCFGHVEYILRHARYAALRESPRDFCQICPCQLDEATSVFQELFREVARSHPSPHLHIGGDETYLLGQCPRCREKAKKIGKSSLYINYMRRMARLVTDMGKRPLIWADMALKHPEALKKLPRETIFVDWNYGWAPHHFGNLDCLKKAGFEIWGAPSLRCHPDNHSLTDWPTHFKNLRDFIPFARKSAYLGMILTSWSTSGIYGHHWEQPGEVIDLLPMRRVYPLSGFRVLRTAFAEALTSPTPLDPKAFVILYAANRFGLSLADGRRFWNALNAPVNARAKGAELRRLTRHALNTKSLLRQLQPTRNRQEFAHFRLMAHFHEIHLRFKQVEEKAQSPALTSSGTTLLVRGLAELLKEAKGLQPEYRRINRQFLYPAEIEAEHAYRIGKMNSLYDRLARTGRQQKKTRTSPHIP